MTGDPLHSTALREAMVAFATRRGAGANAEDLVQLALLEAWSRGDRPAEPEPLRRWLWGILRHKLIDQHRKQRREILDEQLDRNADEAPSPASNRQAEDLLHWASRTLPAGQDARETLAWLLREAEGESLEHIAAEAELPPARVRKRVSRLRDHFRKHWQKEALALAALGITLGLWLWLRDPAPDPTPIARDPAPTEPELRAHDLRERAHEACDGTQWQRCLDLLDQARALHPDEPQAAADDRRRAHDALQAPPPLPSSLAPLSPTPEPTKTAPPPKKPTPTTPSPKSGKPSSPPDFKSGFDKGSSL